MVVDLDNEELPLTVCDSSEELAKKIGVSSGTIRRAIQRAHLNGYKCRYVKVEVNDDED